MFAEQFSLIEFRSFKQFTLWPISENASKSQNKIAKFMPHDSVNRSNCSEIVVYRMFLSARPERNINK